MLINIIKTLRLNFLIEISQIFLKIFTLHMLHVEIYSFVNTLEFDNWERKGVKENVLLLGFHTDICYDLDI